MSFVVIRGIRFYFLGNSQEQNQGRLGAVESGPGQSRVIRVIKIPLNLPLLKGDFNYPTLVIFFLSLDRQRGARGDFKKERFFKKDSTR